MTDDTHQQHAHVAYGCSAITRDRKLILIARDREYSLSTRR